MKINKKLWEKCLKKRLKKFCKNNTIFYELTEKQERILDLYCRNYRNPYSKDYIELQKLFPIKL